MIPWYVEVALNLMINHKPKVPSGNVSNKALLLKEKYDDGFMDLSGLWGCEGDFNGVVLVFNGDADV
jgi:hypothetical protein